MSNLKTNYKDAELSPSMNGKRQYELQYNEAGYTNLVDKTAYTEVGDTFGADDINATNSAVNELNQNLTDYSTLSTEEKVVGKWIDGKTIYSKTLEFNTSNQYSQSLAHNIPDVDLIWLDMQNTFIHITSSNANTPFFYTGVENGSTFAFNNTYLRLITFVDRTSIAVRNGSQALQGKMYITVRYTKM